MLEFSDFAADFSDEQTTDAFDDLGETGNDRGVSDELVGDPELTLELFASDFKYESALLNFDRRFFPFFLRVAREELVSGVVFNDWKLWKMET